MRVQISFWHPNESQTLLRARCLAEQELWGVELFWKPSSCCVGWEYEILVLSSLKAWPYLTNSIISKNPKCRKLQFLLQCPLSCCKLNTFRAFQELCIPIIASRPLAASRNSSDLSNTSFFREKRLFFFPWFNSKVASLLALLEF